LLKYLKYCEIYKRAINWFALQAHTGRLIIFKFKALKKSTRLQTGVKKIEVENCWEGGWMNGSMDIQMNGCMDGWMVVKPNLSNCLVQFKNICVQI
jgi:hypothetical protein